MSKTEFVKKLRRKFEDLKEFEKFTWVNSQSSIISKKEGGLLMVEFQISDGFDFDKNIPVIEVMIYYARRFDILHTWFEKFNFKKKQDIKYTSSIIFEGRDLQLEENFFFKYDMSDFEIEFEKMKNTILVGTQRFLRQIDSLDDLYSYTVVPMLKDDYRFELVGAEWIFEALLLTHLFNPLEFPKLKERLKEHARSMFIKNEPNMSVYYPLFEEILQDLLKVKLI